MGNLRKYKPKQKDIKKLKLYLTKIQDGGFKNK